MTLVSVVVLNYNYARYLPAAIGSALDQTYEDVEVIVVDDASTDNSRSVIEHYGSKIRSTFHETNQGQGAAINSGAAAANGDVIWFLDADDALLPEACATAAGAFERDHRLVKFHTPLAIIDGDGRWAGELLPANPDGLAVGDITRHVFRFRNHGWPPMSGNAYAVGALTRILPIPTDDYRQAADSFLNEQVVICGTVARTDYPVAAYRRHGSNQFSGKPLDLQWLRTKIRRELVSHRRLGILAEQLGIDGYRSNPNDVADISFLGYRLASLRLDRSGHPVVDPDRPDTRIALGVAGIRTALANSQLAGSDRGIRALWFAVVATAPSFAVRRLLGWYMPDGPTEPIWRRRRQQRRGSGVAPADLVSSRTEAC